MSRYSVRDTHSLIDTPLYHPYQNSPKLWYSLGMKEPPILPPKDDSILLGVFIPGPMKTSLKQLAWQERRTLRSVVIEAFELYLDWKRRSREQEKGLDKPDSL